MNPTSPLRKLELPTSQLQAGSLSTAFPQTTSSIFFVAEVRSKPSQTIPWLTTTLVAHRATPSRLGGFTSKSNKCTNKLLNATPSAQDLGLALLCSHTTNLSTQLKDIQSITQVSQRDVGESYNGCQYASLSWVKQHQPKGGVDPYL